MFLLPTSSGIAGAWQITMGIVRRRKERRKMNDKRSRFQVGR